MWQESAERVMFSSDNNVQTMKYYSVPYFVYLRTYTFVSRILFGYVQKTYTFYVPAKCTKHCTQMNRFAYSFKFMHCSVLSIAYCFLWIFDVICFCILYSMCVIVCMCVCVCRRIASGNFDLTTQQNKGKPSMNTLTNVSE